jgi:hypothetical protein
LLSVLFVVDDQRAIRLATVIQVTKRGRGLHATITEIDAVVRSIFRVSDDVALDWSEQIVGYKRAPGEDPQTMRRRSDPNCFLGILHA